ncbi:MAG TPA: PadR family transcriptional regulator [Microbacteriaceae bacterium]|nr:PadR family transcriptional regulator [Microbacteriaceae bacterium]
MTFDHQHHDHKGRGKSGRNHRIGEATRARRPEFGPGFGPGFGPFPPGFGPHGHRMHGGGPRRRSRGDVRAAVLSLLGAEGAEHLNGYAIMKTIAERTEGAWSPSPGSIYPTLQQLVDEGLIAPVGKGRKTEYTLTDEGRAHVAEHAEQLANWAESQRPTDESRALGESVGKLMSVIGQFRHAATDAQRAVAAERLDEARKALYLILAE